MDFLFLCSTLWATASSLTTTVQWTSPSPHCQSETDLPRTGMAGTPLPPCQCAHGRQTLHVHSLEFFEDEQTEIIFYHNHPKRENETVQYNILHKSSTVVLFGMDKSACSFLREQYPDVKFYSQASPFIEFFSSKSRLGNNRKMYAHLRKDAVDVYGYERGRLLLANSFECRSTPDRVYYLLYIWKQLGFEQERDELHLTGDLNDKELLLPELRKFIRQVFIMNPATNLDLQAITLCE